MRIVTWNCSGPASIKNPAVAARRFEHYLELMTPLRADVLVLQEAPKPGAESCHTFWQGSLLGRGLAVILDPAAVPEARVLGQTRSSLLVELGAPHNLNLLAIWSCPEKSGLQNYLLEARAVLDEHMSTLRQRPTLMAGDFNSSALWDGKTRAFSHTDLTHYLETDLGLISAYHSHLSVTPGREPDPTFHQYRHLEKAYHLDYCFLPRTWKVESARVGAHADWAAHSDHCPLIVDAVPGGPFAFIQANALGQAYSQNGAAAARGFEKLGYQVQYVSRAQVESLVLGPADVLVGGAGTVRAGLEKLEVPVPPPLNLPRQLEPYWGRKVWRTTLEELESGPFPVFVKPAEQAKVFEGQVLAHQAALRKLLIARPGFPTLSPGTRVEAQEVVKLVSEWRAFVVRGQVHGFSHYAGDPLVFPSASVIRMTIGAYTQAPAGYSADFAVTQGGQTILVEVNDGWSLGHGGLAADTYASLLEARWREMTGRG